MAKHQEQDWMGMLRQALQPQQTSPFATILRSIPGVEERYQQGRAEYLSNIMKNVEMDEMKFQHDYLKKRIGWEEANQERAARDQQMQEILFENKLLEPQGFGLQRATNLPNILGQGTQFTPQENIPINVSDVGKRIAGGEKFVPVKIKPDYEKQLDVAIKEQRLKPEQLSPEFVGTHNYNPETGKWEKLPEETDRLSEIRKNLNLLQTQQANLDEKSPEYKQNQELINELVAEARALMKKGKIKPLKL